MDAIDLRSTDQDGELVDYAGFRCTMTPEKIKHLDAVAGAQLATFAAVAVLLRRQSKDPGLLPDLQAALEQLQSAALASQSSDYKLQALAESAAVLLEAAQPQS